MTKQKRRNGHAFHPIMKKGGVHRKSKSALRRAAKREIRRQVQERPGCPHITFFIYSSPFTTKHKSVSLYI